MIRLGLAGIQHPHVQMAADEAVQRTDVRLVGLAEAEDDRRHRWAQRLGVPAYRTVSELIEAENVDVVAVGAANHDRAGIIVNALERGVHVISDKPMCVTVEQLDQIETAWRGGSAELSMMLDKRSLPVSVAAHRLVESGELGDLAVVASTAPHQLRKMPRPEWMFDRERYGGILNDLATHDLDLIMQFSRSRSGTVSARTGRSPAAESLGLDDHGVALLSLDNGPLATVQVDWLSPDGAGFDDYRTVLTGTAGTAELRFHDGVLLLTTRHEPRRVMPLDPPKRPLAGFFDALRSGRLSEPDGNQVLAVTRLALLCQRSADQAAPLRWDLA